MLPSTVIDGFIKLLRSRILVEEWGRLHREAPSGCRMLAQVKSVKWLAAIPASRSLIDQTFYLMYSVWQFTR